MSGVPERQREKQEVNLLEDAVIIVLSVLVAIWLVQSGALAQLLRVTSGVKFLESFVGGMFFTSAFTTAPAIVLLGEIARSNHISVFWTSFFGGLGALVGDLVIFELVKDRFSEDLMALIGKKGKERFRHIVRAKLFHRFSPFVAALVIASPLPDELGVALLGFARTRTPLFVLFSFTANFLGILIISLAARAIG